MAIYKNSYLYHTHLDLTNYLESGAIQHLGANTLAIVNYLAQNATLTGIVPSSEVVFFDVQGLFFIVYSWATAYTIQMVTVALVSLYFTYIVYKTHTSSPYRSIQHILLSYTKSVLSIYLSMISAMVLPITVAMVLTSGGFDRHIDRKSVV